MTETSAWRLATTLGVNHAKNVRLYSLRRRSDPARARKDAPPHFTEPQVVDAMQRPAIMSPVGRESPKTPYKCERAAIGLKVSKEPNAYPAGEIEAYGTNSEQRQ